MGGSRLTGSSYDIINKQIPISVTFVQLNTYIRMGWGTFVEDTFVEETLVEWNIGQTEHWSNRTLVERNIGRAEHLSNGAFV